MIKLKLTTHPLPYLPTKPLDFNLKNVAIQFRLFSSAVHLDHSIMDACLDADQLD